MGIERFFKNKKGSEAVENVFLIGIMAAAAFVLVGLYAFRAIGSGESTPNANGNYQESVSLVQGTSSSSSSTASASGGGQAVALPTPKVAVAMSHRQDYLANGSTRTVYQATFTITVDYSFSSSMRLMAWGGIENTSENYSPVSLPFSKTVENESAETIKYCYKAYVASKGSQSATAQKTVEILGYDSMKSPTVTIAESQTKAVSGGNVYWSREVDVTPTVPTLGNGSPMVGTPSMFWRSSETMEWTELLASRKPYFEFVQENRQAEDKTKSYNEYHIQFMEKFDVKNGETLRSTGYANFKVNNPNSMFAPSISVGAQIASGSSAETIWKRNYSITTGFVGDTLFTDKKLMYFFTTSYKTASEALTSAKSKAENGSYWQVATAENGMSADNGTCLLKEENESSSAIYCCLCARQVGVCGGNECYSSIVYSSCDLINAKDTLKNISISNVASGNDVGEESTPGNYRLYPYKTFEISNLTDGASVVITVTVNRKSSAGGISASDIFVFKNIDFSKEGVITATDTPKDWKSVPNSLTNIYLTHDSKDLNSRSPDSIVLSGGNLYYSLENISQDFDFSGSTINVDEVKDGHATSSTFTFSIGKSTSSQDYSKTPKLSILKQYVKKTVSYQRTLIINQDGIPDVMSKEDNISSGIFVEVIIPKVYCDNYGKYSISCSDSENAGMIVAGASNINCGGSSTSSGTENESYHYTNVKESSGGDGIGRLYIEIYNARSGSQNRSVNVSKNLTFVLTLTSSGSKVLTSSTGIFTLSKESLLYSYSKAEGGEYSATPTFDTVGQTASTKLICAKDQTSKTPYFIKYGHSAFNLHYDFSEALNSFSNSDEKNFISCVAKIEYGYGTVSGSKPFSDVLSKKICDIKSLKVDQESLGSPENAKAQAFSMYVRASLVITYAYPQFGSGDDRAYHAETEFVCFTGTVQPLYSEFERISAPEMSIQTTRHWNIVFLGLGSRQENHGYINFWNHDSKRAMKIVAVCNYQNQKKSYELSLGAGGSVSKEELCYWENGPYLLSVSFHFECEGYSSAEYSLTAEASANGKDAESGLSYWTMS
jgi:hypothetical protein